MSDALKKRQHYVPRFYLRRFAEEPSRRAVRCYVIDRSLHIPCAGIADQCAVDFLYDRDNALENALAEMEAAAAPVLAGMVEREAVPEPMTQPFAHLARFAIYQAFRTLFAGSRVRMAQTLFVREIAKLMFQEGTALQREIAAGLRVETPDPVVLALGTAVGSSPVIWDLRLKVIRNESPVEFITSDAPCVLHNDWCSAHRTFGSVGLPMSGLQIFLPLSPRHLATWYDCNVYTVGAPRERVVVMRDPDEVEALNHLQMACAQKCLYYCRAATRAPIDQLRTDVRDPNFGVFVSTTGNPRDGRTQTATHWLPPNVSLKSGAIRVRASRQAIPLRQRVNRFRAQALELLEYHQATRRMRGDDGDGLT